MLQFKLLCDKVTTASFWPYFLYQITGINFKALLHRIEQPKLWDRGLSLVRRFGLCGQDTCLLCLLSLRLSMPCVEHTVTHTICYLQHSWLGQTWLWVGNGADKTCDLDTVSYVWSAERGRGRLMRGSGPLDFGLCEKGSGIPRCLETCPSLCVMSDGVFLCLPYLILLQRLTSNHLTQ